MSWDIHLKGNKEALRSPRLKQLPPFGGGSVVDEVVEAPTAR